MKEEASNFLELDGISSAAWCDTFETHDDDTIHENIVMSMERSHFQF